MGEHRILEALEHLDPSQLNYQEWINVGMALKKEGYAVEDWEQWSSRDSSRYHPGECRRKWRSFRGAPMPVTGGTIVQIAKEHGWKPYMETHELEWDSVIAKDGHTIAGQEWTEEIGLCEPDKWEPEKELITYLETLFGTDEKVGYVTRSWSKPDEEKKYPDKGCWDRTARQLIQALWKCNGDIGSVLGDYNPEVGAWIRFNPLDGKGCKNENVIEYRHALVESDATDLERQNAIIRELELPVACLVHSGNKSLHAIVRVDANSHDEYRQRVNYLYKICRKHGLDVDQQNRNPSRLSRMPGVMRGGKKQFLAATNIGKKSWSEWKEWIEVVEDGLPEPENLQDVWDNLPELAPCLIDGILRQGHKMLIAGPSKAGKSFLQIEMCIAIAEGRQWLEWDCTQGRVLYVNLELDRASCLHRFRDVYQALGWKADNLKNIDIWNLRGKSRPMDKLAPMLIHKAAKKNYIAIVIDPIYKVITGDENSADQMANFCNQFDKVCTELGVAVIYCHHHSKGSQGAKKSMDRASGSGVFARDPDALLDLIELEITDPLLKQEETKAVCHTCGKYLDSLFEWRDDLSQDDLCSSVQMLAYCRNKLKKGQLEVLEEKIKTSKEQVGRMSAWRIEGTLREFPKFQPVNLWFDYPIHKIDESGALEDIQPGEAVPQYKKNFGKKKSTEERKRERDDSLQLALQSNFGNPATVENLAQYMGVSEKTVRRRIKESGKYIIEEGIVKPRDRDKLGKTVCPS